MKLAIMSDSHDNWAMLKKAIETANEQTCEYLLFAGDLISPQGIAIFEQFSGKVVFVWGNNEGEKMGISRMMDALDDVELAGGFYEGELDGVKIFMNHYPKFGEHAAMSGQYDLVIHGHTHEYRDEKFGDTQLINPGEIQGYRTGESTFVIYDTSSKGFEKITL